MKPLALLTLALLAQRPSVTTETVDGRQWWTVRGQDVPLGALLEEIVRRTGRRLEGAERLPEGALVTVELDRRPLAHVLEYVMGTAGMGFELRTDAVLVHDPAAGSPRDLLDEASAAWVRANTRFPGHPMAAAGRLAQGELAEARGDLPVARDHYESLIESHPTAPEVPEATLRVGLLLEREGQWSEASLRFRALAGLESAPEYAAGARLELARCSIELGDPQSALHLLAVLDSGYPPGDALETSARELVRARALIALDQPMQALRAVEPLEGALDPLTRREAMRVRAEALDGIGMPADAARAWLYFGADAGGAERVLALREAARLSLEADDELGVLFVCREAERFGLVEELGPYWHRARVRLGLEEPAGGERDAAGRLASAEELLEAERPQEAAVLLEPLFLARAALDPASRLRLTLAWADATDRRFGIERALHLLAEERATFEEARARSAVDAAAARLLERRGLYERAADAYEGRY